MQAFQLLLAYFKLYYTNDVASFVFLISYENWPLPQKSIKIDALVIERATVKKI